MKAEIIDGKLKVFPGSETEVFAMRTWQAMHTHPHDNTAGFFYLSADLVECDASEVGRVEF